MKGLSLWQPWASLIARGVKKIETRGWSTAYRGPLAIHATKQLVTLLDPATLEIVDDTFGPGWAKQLPRGAIIAVATLTDVRSTGSTMRGAATPWPAPWVPLHSSDEYHVGNYGPGRHGWFLADVRAIDPPLPFVGQQHLFDVPDNVIPPQQEQPR